MKVKQMSVTNLRALEHVEFDLDPSFTLIVGVNGVGKSTLLDGLRICASRILPSLVKSRTRAMSFQIDDIRSAAPFLEVEVSFEHNSQDFVYTRRQWRERFAKDDAENIEKLKREIRDSVRLRDRMRNLIRELNESQGVSDTDTFAPSQQHLKQSATLSNLAPNSIFFSTNRSVVSGAGASTSKAAGREAAAYAEALVPRPLFLAQFADWIRVQDQLASERPLSKRHLQVLTSSVKRFLPNYKNLHTDFTDHPRLLIEKDHVTLDVRQLSDGERGVLALVLDIARRLSQANHTLKDPIRDGEALVLIDEIDLHLHPTWQRSIINKLTETFPNCQFVATTHSPQVVAAVQPEQVLLLIDGAIERPQRTLGMDSNWILRYLMEADERPLDALEVIKRVEEMIDGARFKKAREAIARAKTAGWDFPEWSVLEARMARLEVLS